MILRNLLLSCFLVALCATMPSWAAEPSANALVMRLHAEPGDQRPALAGSARQGDAVRRVVLDHGAPLLVAGRVAGEWHLLKPDTALGPAELRLWAARLRADPRVQDVLVDQREQRQGVTPSDARFAQQWWLQAVAPGNTGAAGFASAWMRSTGAPVLGEAPIVAVLDSGITSHPELDSRTLPGHDFVANPVYANDGDGRDNDPTDPGDAITPEERLAQPEAFSGCPNAAASSWHGTTIAGQVAAVSNNAEGGAAASWNARFLPVRVAGKCGAAVSDIIAGLRWAAGLAVDGAPLNPNPARLIVLSYGGVDVCDVNSATPEIAATSRLYRDAIAEARAAGAMVLVAAGNLRSEVGRPASCSGAFAVASLNREGFKSNYSNFGPRIALATPGGDMDARNTCDTELADSGIVSTGNLGTVRRGSAGYVAASGTSFAAPAVAGVAALMLAVNPALTVAQIEDGLRRSARPHVRVPLLGNCSLADNKGRCTCTSATCGAGMLDADEALLFAAAPATYTAPLRSPPTLVGSRFEICAAKLGRAPPPPAPGASAPAPVASAPSGSGGGGGALSIGWLAGLAFAVAVVASRRIG